MVHQTIPPLRSPLPTRVILGFALVFCSLMAMPVLGQSLEGRVKTHELKNGMTFLLLERHRAPTIAFSMRFRVGSSNEHEGIGGTAHLLEHMLFKGTRTIGTKDWEKERVILARIDEVAAELDAERRKGESANSKSVSELRARLKVLSEEARRFVRKDEIDETYSKNGGVGFNATTDQDLTTYMVSLPANRLELWARIESDRMANPILREFYSERDVIMEERRMSTESSPTGMLWEQFQSAAFMAHRYGVPVIGWMSEISFLSKARTEEFRRTYYAPNNTVTAIVGDFDTARTISLLERYFGSIPSQPLAQPLSCVEPEQIGERRIQVERDANPALLIGYHKPAMPHRDDYVFDALSGILTEGRSSRLYRKLVKELQIAVGVNTTGSYPGNRYSNLFVISVAPRSPHTAAEVEQSIYQEIERLKSEPVSALELQKVQNQLEAGFIRGLDSNEGLAGQLSFFQSLTGDWRYVENHPKVIRTITAAEIQRVASKYLVGSNRTVATLVRVAKDTPPTAPRTHGPMSSPLAEPVRGTGSSGVTSAVTSVVSGPPKGAVRTPVPGASAAPVQGGR